MGIQLRHGILAGDEIWHFELSGLVVSALSVYKVVAHLG